MSKEIKSHAVATVKKKQGEETSANNLSANATIATRMPTEAEKQEVYIASLSRQYGGDRYGSFETNRNDYLTFQKTTSDQKLVAAIQAMPTEAEKAAAHLASLTRQGNDKTGKFDRNRDDFMHFSHRPDAAHPGRGPGVK